MQKLGLTQSLSQKLSPQQIQFIKLLQIPTAELDTRIEEELESNPALEEGGKDDTRDNNEEGIQMSDLDYGSSNDNSSDDSYDDRYESRHDEDLNISDYVNQDDIAGYKMYGDGNYDEEDREQPIKAENSLIDSLLVQLSYLKLSPKEMIIGKQLIGSIDEDGYIRRDIEAIIDDLAFLQKIDVNLLEVQDVLERIQRFEPAGIGARDLQECLLLQLRARDTREKNVQIARRIIEICFEEFKKKHYSKIEKKLGISEDELKLAMDVIIRLNPKPGGSTVGSDAKTQFMIPDFILKNGILGLEVSLNSKNAPDLRVSRSYSDMLDAYNRSDKKDKKLKQTVSFVKQKLDSAKWFIDAIKQRQHTLLRTMEAIMRYQYDFFQEGDESKLKPMILKDIAREIGMDISTVSRVANSKSVQTDFGIFPLKFFFSESISTDTGEDVSSKEVKFILKEIIEKESKRKPLSDDKLEKMLKDKGYNIARRTVAKYREQLNIPVARLRKEL
ncbi:MAG: RNA polymerase sigma-54 factor [Cytophagales bacterium]|nr:MAG: RNA polymerase sigma-54 factor [Cytophagales bacterium]TAF61625.1 MAG: RNA polymerase sigma-54 factor [Cytophagales bacterium]